MVNLNNTVIDRPCRSQVTLETFLQGNSLNGAK